MFILTGKGSLMFSLLAPAQLHKNGPWAWNPSLPGMKSPHFLSWDYHLVCEYLSCFMLVVCSFVLLSMCIIWHLVNSSSAISVLCVGGTVSFHCRTRGVHIGHLPCVGSGKKPVGHGGPVPNNEVDLPLSLFYVSNV